jgi:hypothetical protein
MYWSGKSWVLKQSSSSRSESNCAPGALRNERGISTSGVESQRLLFSKKGTGEADDAVEEERDCALLVVTLVVELVCCPSGIPLLSGVESAWPRAEVDDSPAYD